MFVVLFMILFIVNKALKRNPYMSKILQNEDFVRVYLVHVA